MALHVRSGTSQYVLVGFVCLLVISVFLVWLRVNEWRGGGMACKEEFRDQSLDESALCQGERSVWTVICRARRGFWDGCRGNF